MADRALDRLAVGVLERLGMRLWGFPPRLMAPIVAELGAWRALTWFAGNMPRYERTLRVLGPLRTHLLCTVISLYNGCRYCSYGHAYALELIYLKERDRLFPVEAREMCEWLELDPGQLRDQLVNALQSAELHVEVLWVDRALALVSATHRPMDSTEARIAHLVRMFQVLNAVGIASGVEPDEAHDAVNKDEELKARHAAMRRHAA